MPYQGNLRMLTCFPRRLSRRQRNVTSVISTVVGLYTYCFDFFCLNAKLADMFRRTSTLWEKKVRTKLRLDTTSFVAKHYRLLLYSITSIFFLYELKQAWI